MRVLVSQTKTVASVDCIPNENETHTQRYDLINRSKNEVTESIGNVRIYTLFRKFISRLLFAIATASQPFDRKFVHRTDVSETTKSHHYNQNNNETNQFLIEIQYRRKRFLIS